MVAGIGVSTAVVTAADPAGWSSVKSDFKEFCLTCHSAEKHKGDVDLEQFRTLDDIRKQPKVWQAVVEQMELGEMPPKDKPQPTAVRREAMLDWTRATLDQLALEKAGDPGPVLLRRLSNAEYTYTIRDLTGVPSLDPAQEFPVDGAAGEGFVNTGQSLVISPSLLTKYLDAAKGVAAHAVLLPDRIAFSPHTTRRDQTEDLMGRIRTLYRKYSDASGADRVNLQGIIFDTNEGGRVPVARYLTATIEDRAALAMGSAEIERVAKARGLSPVYLGKLYSALRDERASFLLDPIRERWRKATVAEVPALVADITAWQAAVWKFSPVGHIGKLGGPKAWMEPVTPVLARQELRMKVPAEPTTGDWTVYLAAGNAGDGATGDVVRWVQPRLSIAGKPEIPLAGLRSLVGGLEARRDRFAAGIGKYLTAAAESASATSGDLDAIASKHGIRRDELVLWLDYLGLGPAGPLKVTGHMATAQRSLAGHAFVNGWGNPDLPSIVANSSDQSVRIPGDLRARSVAMHPSPTLQVAAGWLSPMDGAVTIQGVVQHAHPECGNGVTWSVELRRGSTRRRLAQGFSQGPKEVPFGPLPSMQVQVGDLVSVLIGPRDGNHSCDLTRVDITLTPADAAQRWNLAADVSPDITAANPHADRQGHAGVWHFYTEAVTGAGDYAAVVPAGSLLARWMETGDAAARVPLVAELRRLVSTDGVSTAQGPDANLRRQLLSLSGPLLGGARLAVSGEASVNGAGQGWGLDPGVFGKAPASVGAAEVGPMDLCVQVPSVLEIRLPRELVAGREFVVTGELEHRSGAAGSVQFTISTNRPSMSGGIAGLPVVVADTGPAKARIEAGFDDFRALFPAALCYTKIVPVDEVVTLTLHHREDDALRRLMLSDREAEELDQLWAELRFVSQDALTLVDAFEQLWQYATQDADPKVFEPLREPIKERAARFREEQAKAEPLHLQAAIEFARRVYRRPLTEEERQGLRGLYQQLRTEGLAHDESIRFVIARALVAPAFLYRAESPGPGKDASPVNEWEMASRLSYFLWSSLPDGALRQSAAAGRLQGGDAIAREARRMLKDEKVRRLAIEFGCAWLHIHGFDTLDEKSERHFPTFVGLRGAMYEESIQFFTDFFQNDRSVIDLLDSDRTFLNEALAKHYGIPGVQGPEWRMVSGIRQHGRGGILGQAAVLAKQSGASRTSPILRGNWLCEVLLGEKLPKPPKEVPRLPEDEAGTDGLTVRQLVEKHSSDTRCSGCHRRMDPYGFALEAYDAIGRRRERDLGDRPVMTRVTAPDHTEFEDMAGLRAYLVGKRRDAFVRQFCRKLLGYALGRSVQLSDGPLLNGMHASLKANEYRVSAAIETLVRSPQFLNIRGRDAAED